MQTSNKCILVGHPGSQKIVMASKYLTNKYMPDFQFTYLNYKGKIEGWGIYVAGFLQYLTDEYVIFALDDYLIAEPIEFYPLMEALSYMGGDIACAKLCYATPEENLEYPVSTQYTLWNREYLIGLLYKTHTPWRFEIEGSGIFKASSGICLHKPCIKYFTNSSLSSRWEGVRLDGLNDEDIQYLKENKLL